MLLSREFIAYISRELVKRMTPQVFEVRSPEAAIESINNVIEGDLAIEDRLNEDVRDILAQYSDYMRREGVSYQEMFRKIKNKLVKFDVYMNELEKKGDQGKLERVRKEKLKILKILEKRSLRLFNLREKFEEHVPSEVIVHGAAYPGVLIESHGRTYEVMKQVSGVAFFFDRESGHIKDKVLEKK